MTESKRRSTKTRAADAGAQGFTLPSDDELAAAVASSDEQRAQSEELAPGTVIGIDTARFVCAILDLKIPALRQEYFRTRYRQKGYVRVQGQPTVVGYEKAEVWIKRREDAEHDLRRRRAQIENHVIEGRMHRSALGGRAYVQKELPTRTHEII